MKRSLQAWILGWAVSFAFVASPSVIPALVKRHSFFGTELAFYAGWSFIILTVVFVFLILPAYLWLPDRVRELPALLRCFLGGIAGMLVATSFLLPFYILSTLPAAFAAGCLIGYMIPKHRTKRREE